LLIYGRMKKLKALLLLTAIGMPASAVALDDSPLKLLESSERAYYDLVFNYTMDAIRADGKYSWQSYGGQGTISVSDSYISKSGATCRNFAEIFTVQGVAGENEGVGCKRVGYDGWCKLRMTDARTCAMEPNSTIVEDKLRDAREYIQGKEGRANGIMQMLP
jgi:hypothetical protein